MPLLYEFREARFCHESFAVSAPKATKASEVDTTEAGCGPDMPQDPYAQSNFPHQHDPRDDGRSDPRIEFQDSDTFQCLESAKKNGLLDPLDYPEILEEAAKLYSHLQ
jgi:hypothetical protein